MGLRKRLGILKNGTTYKKTVRKAIISLVVSFICIFFIFYAQEKVNLKLSMVRQENAHCLEKFTSAVNEEFNGIIKYYVRECMRDEIDWMINNDIDYSQFKTFKNIGSALEGTGISSEYINSYAIVNYSKGWVFDKKGIYPIEQMYNKEEIDSYYTVGNEIRNKYFCMTVNDAVVLPEVSRDYRYLVETSGLNVVIELPVSDVNVKGMLFVNLENDIWDRLIGRMLENSDQKFVVLGENGNMIYTNDEKFANICMASESIIGKDSILSPRPGEQYAVSVGESEMLGYKFIVGTDLTDALNDAIRDVLLLMIFVSFIGVIVSYLACELLYKPVRKMINGLAETTADIEGDEFKFIEKQVINLREDKKQIEQLVKDNNLSLQELLEIRLVNGKIRNEEDWNAYALKLNLKMYNYYVCVSAIIDMSEDDGEVSEVDEAAICMNIVESLPGEIKEQLWLPLLCDLGTMYCFLGADAEDDIYELIKTLTDALQKHSRNCVGYSLMIGISGVHSSITQFGLAHYESIRALTMDKPEAGNCNFFLSGNMASYAENEFDYDAEIIEAIRRMDKEQCYRIIDNFDAFLVNRGSQVDSTVFVMRMIDSILMAALESRVEIEKIFPKGVENLINEILRVNEHSRVRRLLKKQLLDPVLDDRSRLLELDAYATTEQITQLISEAKGNITLNELAEKMDVHPAFIWKTLKMENGKTFSDIQESYKLDEAKRLLLQTNLTVAEISAELNYTNAQNFIRFFSKETGMTPGKFRKLKQL